MGELISTIDEYIHHTNELTKEMDEYLVFGNKYLEFAQTYIYATSHEYADGSRGWGIRYPGATRGSIVTKDDIITRIYLYEDEYKTDGIYKYNVRDIFEKYIGMKLIMK